MSQQPSVPAFDRLIPARDVHHETLKNAIPDWLGDASAARRNALKTSAPAGYAQPSAEQDTALKGLIREAWVTQNLLDKAMDALKSPADFAAPV